MKDLQDASFSRRRRPLYPGGPEVSVVGFGASRLTCGPSGARGRDALAQALKLGVNLIDCRAAASDAQSEQAVAEVLAQARLPQESLALITKVGQVRGHDLEWLTSELWESHGSGFAAEAMMLAPDHGVCFEPRFLEHQIRASLQRFGSGWKPMVLLEMPEDCIRYAALRGLDRQAAHDLFASKLTGALGLLKSFWKEGVIEAYGVSSETLGYPSEHPLSFALSDLIRWNGGEIAGLRVVSIPLNWIEWRGLQAADPNAPMSEADFWSELRQFEFGLVTQRPLNALSRGQLIRLARPHLSLEEMAGLDAAKSQALERWASMVSDLEAMAGEVLAEYLPEEPKAPLSQLVISTLTALPELSSVLVGMHRPGYVEDVKNALSLPRPLRARDALDAIHERFEFGPG